MKLLTFVCATRLSLARRLLLLAVLPPTELPSASPFLSPPFIQFPILLPPSLFNGICTSTSILRLAADGCSAACGTPCHAMPRGSLSLLYAYNHRHLEEEIATRHTRMKWPINEAEGRKGTTLTATVHIMRSLSSVSTNSWPASHRLGIEFALHRIRSWIFHSPPDNRTKRRLRSVPLRPSLILHLIQPAMASVHLPLPPDSVHAVKSRACNQDWRYSAARL